MVLLVGDVDALEAVDVPRQAGLVDVSLSGLDGLHKSVVNEYVLKKRFSKNTFKLNSMFYMMLKTSKE